MVRGGKGSRSTRASTVKGLVKKIVMTAFVVVNVLGIALAPAQPALAASFTFTQEGWAASADTNATAGHTDGQAQTGVTSFYSTDSSYLTTGGENLTIATSSGSFAQTTWSSVNQTTSASHTGDQTGWTSASTTDSQIDYTGTAGSLKLSSTSYSVTDDGTLTTTGSATGGDFDNGANSSTRVNSTGSTATVGLSTTGGATVAIETLETGFLALKSDGTVHAWGAGGYGRLGDGSGANRTTPVQVSGLGAGSGVIAISGGGDHALALKSDGTVVAWGYTSAGVGDGTTGTVRYSPVQVSGLTAGSGVIAIATGGDVYRGHSLALKSDGTVLAWGVNQYGQLGDNSTTNRTTPVQVSGLGAGSGVIAIAAGVGHSLALKSDGTVLAWGYNAQGQLGDGTTTQSLIPIQVSSLGTGSGVTAIAGGGGVYPSVAGYSLALKSDGTVLAWGYNGHGQLGDNTTTNRTTPVQVSGLGAGSGAVGIAAGWTHSLAVLSDGTTKGWGYNSYYEVGDGTTTQRKTPVQVSGLGAGSGVVAVSAHGQRYGRTSLALKNDGTVFVWGGTLNQNNLLGHNPSIVVNGCDDGEGGTYDCYFPATTPQQVHGVSDVGYLLLNVYNSSGTFTSNVIDLGAQVGFSTLSYTTTVPSDTGVTIDIRAGNSDTPGGETWTDWQTGIASGGDISVLNGKQYVQYRANFTTSSTAYTATLNDITINYMQYPTSVSGYWLVSSPFNTEDSGFGIGSVSWNGATTSEASLRFQVRTASSLEGLSSASWCGPTDCSGTDYFVDANNGASIANTALTDGSNDQWFQYKAILTTSNPGVTPELMDVTVAYARALDSVNGYTLISSPYNSGSSANVIGDVRMNVASLPSGTAAKIQVRTASSQGGLSSASWCGTDCTGSTYFTATGTGTNLFNSLPDALTSGDNDQWFQYRITLIPSPNNLNAPYVASVSVTYVVNTAPTVTNVTATTAATTNGAAESDAGKITVTYNLADDPTETSDTYEAYLFYDVGVTLSSDNTTTLTVSDTSKLPSSGYVQIGTEVIKYTSIVNSTTLGSLTRGGSDNSWPGTSTRHTRSYSSGSVVWVKASSVTGDVGSVTTGNGKTIVWDPASESQLANYSKYDAKVRVLVHDGNLANQLSSQNGSSADSDANVIIDNLAPTFSFTFDAGVAGETDTATVSMSTTGDATSTAQYMIADDAATHSTASSTPWTTFTTPGSKAWTFDSDFEVKTLSVQVRDPYGNAAATSTASTIMPAASDAFLVQDVSKVATSDWRLFIGWETATSGDFASYKIEYATSTDNNTFSSYINATTPITNISTNYYVHQNLNTNLYYRYRLGVTNDDGHTSIRSNASTTAKPDGAVNLGEGGGGNTPPTITDVSFSAEKATSINISFDATNPTSGATNAAVYFATQTDFGNNVDDGKTDRERYTTKIANSGYITSDADETVTHTVTLTGLTKNTTYRYAVESCSAAGDCRFEDALDDGYEFETQNGPAIIFESILATPAYDSAVITWKTDKASDSIVFYATEGISALVNPVSVGSNTQVTSADGNWQYVHTVHIPGLTPSTTYYYKVRSTDQNSSSDTYTQYDESTIRSFTTTAPLPPTITTAAACSATNSTITVSWATDQLSTTEVSVLSADVSANYFSTVAGAQVAQYPTGTIDSASRATADYVTSHSNTFSGLTQSTTYYLKVRSLNSSGGEVSDTLTCATTATETLILRPAVVQDVTPPIINSMVIKDITASAVTITWLTDEPADSLVKYGLTSNYGLISGTEELSVNHEVALGGLKPKTTYNFKVTSADGRGNRSYEGDQTVTTLSIEEEAAVTRQNLETLKQELEAVESEGTVQQKTESLAEAVKRFKAILKTVSSDVSLQDLEELTTDISDTITDITQELIPPAIIGGVPQVEVESNSAKIVWRTNKPSGSIIAVVPQDRYDAAATDPYTLQVGQPREEVTQHTVTVPNLEPSTVYHFQIRSQAKVGPEGKSRDFVFETKPELPEIIDYAFKRITENSITVAWKTNTLSNSQVHYTPFDGATLLDDESRTQGTPEFVKDHEVTVTNLSANTNFLIEIVSADVTGAKASKVIGTIHTTVDEQAPTISKVRSEATIFPGKTERTQTIIYWETDEPSTSQVFWKEGVGAGELTASSRLDKEYTTSHVAVITNFAPGAVYRFQVESVDPSGNASRSSDYTILTPKKGETVIDLIITNFQGIFGFLKNL